MEFANVIRGRRSCRAYCPDQITDEQLNALLEAAALAPVGMGRNDRELLRVVQNPTILTALNADFAASIGNVAACPTYNAPTVIFVLGRRDDPEMMLGANAACMVENMSLAATDLGLGSVYLMGICRELKDSAQAATLLKIPADYRLVSAVAVGYPAQEIEAREPDLERYKTTFIK